MYFIGRDFIQYPYKSCIYPAVSTTPVTIFSIRFFVRRIKILIAPPQAIFRIIHSGFSVHVTSVRIHIPHLIVVFLFTGHFPKLSVDWHCHLDSVNPPPIVHLRSIDYHIDTCFYIPDHIRIGRTHIIKVDINLSAAMVVCVTGRIAVSHSPFVEISPIVGILIIILTRVNAIQSH